MPGDLFYWLLNMSIISAATTVIILIIRSIRKVPSRAMVFLWALPFIRMLVPLGINSRYSLMSQLPKLLFKTITVYDSEKMLELSTTNTIMAVEEYFPLKYKTESLELLFNVASLIWLIGAVSIILTLAALYIATMREVNMGLKEQGEVYCSENIISPAVYGIIRPKIIIPSSTKEADKKYIVMHETEHLKMNDNLRRILGFLAVSLHWFNPFAWLALKLMLEDMELACDERVASKLTKNERGEYAKVLLGATRRKDVFVSAFGGARVRTRVENILSFRKMTWLSITVFSIFSVATAFILLTNAA